MRELNRRDFLRTAGTTAARGAALALVSNLLDTGSASAAGRRPTSEAWLREHGAEQADAALRAAGRTAPVLLGGAEVRPPSVPLAVRSPYLSTWLPATDLTAASPQFWTGSTRGFVGLIRIDRKLYAWAGQPVVKGATVTPMTQISLRVTATRSIFTLHADGIELTAEWLSPIEPGDLRRESVPLTLLTVSVRAVDGASHEVALYADITGEWASSDETDVITWARSKTSLNRYWSTQLRYLRPLTETSQMANWGRVVWGSPQATDQTYQSGYALKVRDRFADAGALANTDDRHHRAIADNQPVFAFARSLGAVSTSAQSVTFAIGHLREPLVSYGSAAEPLAPWWTKYWSHWHGVADFFLADAAAARMRATALDTKIEDAARNAAGPGYAAICALASRQCYGGMELAIGPKGTPWLMGKEISSDGDVNTVDIFDEAYLMWLWLDPDIVPLVMEPVLTWTSSPGWQDDSLWADIPSWEKTGSKYCAHDLGVYPVASGRAPGVGEQMPIEESAGILIMAASYARRVGTATARPFLHRWKAMWTQWGDYLLTQVPTPATQLTTDDWAPVYTTPTGGTNLGIKAIIGLAAAAQIAEILGETERAASWSAAAKDNVGPWARLSLDPSGQYLNLEQGASDTWTTIYNAFYEVVIGESLVPKYVKELQASFYLSQLEPYGLPLQTDSEELTKVAWTIYTAGLLRDYPIAIELLNRAVAYVDQTPSLVPYGDRYNTATGVEVTGIQAHPTLGAVFALMLTSEPPVTTTVSQTTLVLAPGTSQKLELTNTNTDPSHRPLTAHWSATAPPGSGIAVTPGSGSDWLRTGASATVTVDVSVAADAVPGTVSIPIGVVGSANGTSLASPGAYVVVDIT